MGRPARGGAGGFGEDDDSGLVLAEVGISAPFKRVGIARLDGNSAVFGGAREGGNFF